MIIEKVIEGIVNAIEITDLHFLDRSISDLDGETSFKAFTFSYSNEQFFVKFNHVRRDIVFRIWDRFPDGCTIDLESLRIAARNDIKISKELIMYVITAMQEHYGFEYINPDTQAVVQFREVIREKTELNLYGVEAKVTLQRKEIPRCCDFMDVDSLTCTIKKGAWS